MNILKSHRQISVSEHIKASQADFSKFFRNQTRHPEFQNKQIKQFYSSK
jgi:hypothetical protein